MVEGDGVAIPSRASTAAILRPPQAGWAMRTASAAHDGRAVLHVVVVDARRSQVQWAGEVVSEAHASLSPAIAAELASRLADLVAAPAE